MNEPRNFNEIPAGACVLTVGEFELGDNGEGAKTAPVRLVARSGKPIEHWFWGRIVHDLSGMRLHKSRLPIDYVHDAKEVIGYLNKFDSTSGDLVTSGALVPFKDSDRATEILHKMRAGVPYEASINFGGDGIKVQQIGKGEMVEVNGARFDGPGVIVREWPLRGVAICPYGADANTASAVLAGDNAKTYRAAVIAAQPATTEAQMSDAVKSVEVAAKAETPQATAETKPEALAAPAAEAKPAEAAPAAVEAPPAVDPVPVAMKAEASVPATLSREEVGRIADKFGAAIAVQVVRDGGDYHAALELAFEANEKEIKRLRGEVAELKSGATASPVKVVPAPVDGKDKSKLFNTGKK